MDDLDIEAVDWLVGRLCRWLVDPDRKLPIGVTLADIAGDDLDDFTDHAAETLGTVANLAEDRSIHYAFRRAAAHGGLACRHWWGTPAWPRLVDRFLTALDDPTDPHWGTNSERFSRLPARPRQIKDGSALRRLLLQHPWKLEPTAAGYIVTAGIGYMRESIPPLPTASASEGR